MLSLKSFGVPYMAPVSPSDYEGMKDVVIRSPLWWMPKRPNFLHPSNQSRLPENENKMLEHSKLGNDQREGTTDGGSEGNNSTSSHNDLN